MFLFLFLFPTPYAIHVHTIFDRIHGQRPHCEGPETYHCSAKIPCKTLYGRITRGRDFA